MHRLKNYLLEKSYLISNVFLRNYQKVYYRRLRKRLKNRDFSLFSPNCYTGLIYHRLGLQFKSTTINLNYSCTSETASANGCALSDINITDTLQSFPPKKGALLPWGSDNF